MESLQTIVLGLKYADELDVLPKILKDFATSPAVLKKIWEFDNIGLRHGKCKHGKDSLDGELMMPCCDF